MQTAKSNVAQFIKLDGKHDVQSLRDENYCARILEMGAEFGLIHADHKAKADEAGGNMSRALYLFAQGYFLRLEIPELVMNDTKAWKLWVSEDGENHAANLVRSFAKFATDLVRQQPTKYSARFFDGDPSKRGQSSYWKQRISQIRTALEDGVNIIATDANGAYICNSIDDAQKQRAKIKAQNQERANEKAAVADRNSALATPDGKKKAIVEAVAESLKTTLLQAASLDELLWLIEKINPVGTVAKQFNSMKKGSFSDNACAVTVETFNRELATIKAFNLAEADAADDKLKQTMADIAGMTREPSEADALGIGEPKATKEGIETLEVKQAFAYGKECSREGQLSDWESEFCGVTQNYIMFHKGFLVGLEQFLETDEGIALIGEPEYDAIKVDMMTCRDRIRAK